MQAVKAASRVGGIKAISWRGEKRGSPQQLEMFRLDLLVDTYAPTCLLGARTDLG